MKDIGAEWDRLCKTYEAANQLHQAAFGAVNKKMRGPGNPTEGELDAMEASWKDLENIKKRMAEFVRMNT